MKPRIGIAILAAGASARMRGRDKLMEPVTGMPILRRQAELACATGLPVFVGLSPDHPARRMALEGLKGCLLKDIPDCRQGMSGSLRAAVTWAQEKAFDGVMILLADMPDLELQDLIHLHTAFQQNPTAIWRATDTSNQPGHPVILPARLFSALAHVQGDDGGRSVIGNEVAQLLPLPDRRATTDLDTPEEWDHWRARTRH